MIFEIQVALDVQILVRAVCKLSMLIRRDMSSRHVGGICRRKRVQRID